MRRRSQHAELLVIVTTAPELLRLLHQKLNLDLITSLLYQKRIRVAGREQCMQQSPRQLLIQRPNRVNSAAAAAACFDQWLVYKIELIVHIHASLCLPHRDHGLKLHVWVCVCVYISLHTITTASRLQCSPYCSKPPSFHRFSRIFRCSQSNCAPAMADHPFFSLACHSVLLPEQWSYLALLLPPWTQEECAALLLMPPWHTLLLLSTQYASLFTKIHIIWENESDNIPSAQWQSSIERAPITLRGRK